jgi:hypothetical protein
MEHVHTAALRGLNHAFGRRLHPQDIPGDIGAQVLAPDSAAGRALDGRAELSRHRTATFQELTDELGAAVNGASQGNPTAQSLDRAVNGGIHAG